MSIRSVEAYKQGLRDGRVVYFRGQQVEDVTAHPDIGIAVKHASLDFELAEDPKWRDLFTVSLPNGERISRYFVPPQSTQDLLRRREMIETSTRLGGGVVLLIKEIGTDALFALSVIAPQVDAKYGTRYADHVRRYHEHCQTNDLSMAVAQTDVKGDRSLLPHQQANPDYYVRVVERRSDGIVVRGAKAHTTCAPYVDEIIVLPTRALSENDKDYAVAFAVPANTKGLKFIVSPHSVTSSSTFQHPVSSRHRMMESLTVLDDVFVPKERVFLCGEWEFAGPLALTFVEFHRFTAVSYKPPLIDLLIGGAALMADYNGISKASHVREKLFHLITYVETVRALSKAAAYDCQPRGHLVVPNPVITNICKYYFASNYHQMVQYVQDIAGGLLVTAPSEEEMANPETRGDIEKYLGGAGVGGEQRLRLMNFLRDLCASDFGGYHEVLAIHAEGSLEAQKITIARSFNVERCKCLVEEALLP